MNNDAVFYKRRSQEDKKRQIPSLPSQDREVRGMRNFSDFHIIDDGEFEESKSAKAPGRPKFKLMLDLLKVGKAQNILCWSVNRLARNGVDAGEIIWLVQNGVKIVTPSKTYTIDDIALIYFEMLLANQFIIGLTKDSARGIQDKILAGKAPLLAPLGYINDTSKKKAREIFYPTQRDSSWLEECGICF